MPDKAKNEIALFFRSITAKDVPKIVQSKFMMFVILSMMTAALGLLMFILFRPGIMVIPTSLMIGALILIYGIVYKYTVVKNGYIVKVGECIDHLREYGIGNIGKAADAVLIETEDEIINLPVGGRSNIPPVGTTVEVYVSPTSAVYDYNGRNIYGTIYGYAIVPNNDHKIVNAE